MQIHRLQNIAWFAICFGINVKMITTYIFTITHILKYFKLTLIYNFIAARLISKRKYVGKISIPIMDYPEDDRCFSHHDAISPLCE